MVKQKPELRNIELRIGYQGTRYCGWQIQPQRPTVQGLIQDTLARVLQDKDVRTVGSSRTDTGVHAHDNRVGFRTTSNIPLEGLVRTMNHILPADIRVFEGMERPAGFSVRHDARAKHYTYFFFNDDSPSPFVAPYLWRYRPQLDDRAMAQAAALFEGKHCFKALQASADHRDETETTIFQATVHRYGPLIAFDVIGRHFLYHMVRNMAGALMIVGRGEWSVAELRERLASGERTALAATAPAQGLHLFEVFYGEAPYEIGSARAKFQALLLSTLPG